jgi:hypothetical protein
MFGHTRAKRPLLESEILAAQSISRSAEEAARKLGVHHTTYKKYARLYGVYERLKNPSGKGIPKVIHNCESGQYPLSKVFANEFPNYKPHKLMKRCIQFNKLEEKCNKCGFQERRLVDNHVPVILNFIDGNSKNMALENLELLCYNCYFLHVNNPHGTRKTFNLNAV